MGDPVLHIDLRDWADILVVAPLSAHTLAKFAHGLCDDTLSCVIRAWDFGHRKHTGCSVPGGKPLVLVPAMNTAMWDHPLTHQQLSQIQSWHALSNARFPVEGMGSSSSVQNDGKHNTSNEVDSVFSLGNYSRGVVVVPPQSKRLACGDVGFGAMAEIATIREMVQTVLLGADANSRQDG